MAMSVSDKNKDILFVLVVYECKIEESVSFKTLIKDTDDVCNVFVYDNSHKAQCVDLPIAHYVSDTNNGGIGKAYNAACDYAKTHGYRWLLLLDQDTTFPAGATIEYRKAIENNHDIHMIVPRHKISDGRFLSPTPYRMKSSDLQDDAPTGITRYSDASPINSGILVSVESFQQAGGYDPHVWLDFSDICFIERYKKSYSTYYILPNVICQQTFSGEEKDSEKIMKRFCIYLECARNYPRNSIKDSLELLIATLRPTISRTIKEKTLGYLKSYWTIYIFKHYNRKRA